MSLPIIDINPLTTGESDLRSVGDQIQSACRASGFFYITGHGVSRDLQEKLEAFSSEFFSRPIDEKMKIRMELAGPAWRGYFPVGGELTSGVPDLKEGIYFGEELRDDDPRVKAGLPLHGQNLFPDDMPEFRGAVLEYLDAMKDLGHAIMRGISVSLHLDAETIYETYTADPLTLFRIFHYPPAGQSTVQDQWGVGEHTDYGLLTILKQDDNGGLQVKSRTGWIPAPPVRDTFVCNIGDMLERLTQGYYRSTAHRVRNETGQGRLSFPYFFDPGFPSPIPPLDLRHLELPANREYQRWDLASVHDFEGTYGDYILAKVGKVFPELKRSVDHNKE
jgi:isopenicillin N synthase-like dioxygenase